ncbi:MAG: branched-chain amino acid transport system permease protein [Chloroflexota bacterium]|jgi:branched-chain amino acid transport system permease protein|nr:branched-chain amino acid transport system permease protein [Chloroflexota bacterium]
MLTRIRRAPPRYWLVLVIAVLLLGLPSVVTSFQSSQWALVLIFAIAIMGLNVLVGYSGQISLGHGAFMALGAYTSAILITRYHLNYLVTIPIAGLVTGAIGFLLGIPALRLSALYLALATFALAVVTPSLIKRPEKLTGGVQGILLVSPDPPDFAKQAFGAVTNGPQMTSEQWIYYLSLGIGAVLFWFAWNMVRHRPGRAMRAIRDGEVAAAASGINVAGYKTLAFGMSAFYAGVAGSLYALTTGFVSPDTFPVALSFQLLVGAVIGGLASTLGPILGGTFVYWLPIVSSQTISSQAWIPSQISEVFVKAGPAVTYGALLILIMVFAPTGVVGLMTSGYAALRKRIREAGERGAGQMPPDPQTM